MSQFTNPNNIVASMGLQRGDTVADFGCGSGYYVVPAAQMVGVDGVIYAVDVQASMCAVTQSSAKMHNLKNVRVVQADLTAPLKEIEATSCDAVIIGSVLHQVENAELVLRNAYKLLKTGGKLLVIEWKPELTTFGPPMEKRIPQKDVEKALTSLGLKKDKEINTDSFHYALVFIK